MPERAIIPLLPAVALGFIGGIISSALQLGDGGTLAVAIGGAALVVVAATSSVLGVGADAGEKATVAALRAGCAVALFACIFLFIIGFLRSGKPVQGLLWLLVAGVFGLLLSRLRVRDREEMRGGGTRDRPA